MLTATAALVGAALPSTAAAGPGGSGTGTWVWVLAAIGAVVLVFVLLRLRSGSSGGRSSVTDVADGRQILIARGRRVTEQLTALADVVAEREDEGATRWHQQALGVVTEARGRIGRTAGQRVQSKAHQDLDEAEWLIGVLRARLDGFVEPAQVPRGVPATCFFDAHHGFAAVEIDLDGIALQRVPVRSCASCAISLVRGERPPFGWVAIGGHDVPWPAAPRWCGSYGWALKDLKHLSYDGVPIFSEASRADQPGRRRQTVAERARSVRVRVLPEGPRVLPEEEPVELAADFDAPDDHDERRTGERRTGERRSGERGEQHEQASPRRSAFAMDDDAPAEVEAAPVATGETPAE
jgi:diadenosine tetraphosphatase ApaH/serine/threonine PP2A family protein phosphatase